MADSLYVHIPFCAHICGYCDFTKVLYQEEWAFSYVDRLIEQLDGLGINKPLKTVYVGGGTPSSLPSDLLKKVLSKLSTYLDKPDYEFTIEANPENLNEEKLLIMRECGVNRLSIGVESSHLKFLNLMGRAHTFEEAKEKVELAQKCGFANITVDLIYGLPTETLEDVKQD
ncbi:MAG: radical SAM protein, partial [Bacilli bacterium]|nr:radical SAM protein [Bacilli bacterium]